ncbi:thiamine biosynthesis protein ThiS [Desulforamulus profundi]|uniref:Thiamine biosynthesis protein ThiS n=1 Tax=Desulforamulus profundi TaxID=1383067 RepID=A0A2C6MGT7_9FIRM|nr:sulfur carrier protein ThiS [Desulforamulus profundi]MCL4442332.1 sulfur carrier protein ThiS [Bacillota bacterium]MCL5779686.1 sulfur carrier protein ThiS [Bacillota bacterium]PHJ38683.1 thiamine biosynthesis protein ThiS [Desulforamulus profundi]
MKILYNGKELLVEDGITIARLLNQRGLKPDTVIVEYNYQLVMKETWSNITLKENDVIEVLRFVGGG